MKAILLILVVVVISVTDLKDTSTGIAAGLRLPHIWFHQFARNELCREISEVTRCAKSPTSYIDGQAWCPFRLCGPSFVSAHDCPADEQQADHKCQLRRVNKPIWLCEPSGPLRQQDDVTLCRCEKRQRATYILVPVRKYVPSLCPK